MLPPTPQLLVSTATTLAAREFHRKAPRVEDRHARADQTRGDATLRFVHFAGFWSHFVESVGYSSWPLPPSRHIEDLAEFAEAHGGVTPRPVAGDVFLLASVRCDRHVRAGIVSGVETVRTTLNDSPTFICATIEGELAAATAGHAAHRLIGVRLARRQLSTALGDCFIRWSDLAVDASWSDAVRRAGVAYEVPRDLVAIGRGRRSKAA